MTSSQGGLSLCPAPFLVEDKFPKTGGFIPGRFCQPFPSFNGNASCCLPCPQADWTYSDNFASRTLVANWLNVAALLASVFLLVSFAFLPVKWTHRHYLSICLACGVTLMQIAFIIPLAAKPDQCHNAITPNDMHTNASCALSGAFLLAGGWAAVMWVFYRALALHLQICWEVIPGKKFFWSSLALGWGLPAVGLAIALSLTGVSFRFGNVCHINHGKGLGDFWIPLLVFAAASMILQFATLLYCIQVYLKSLLDDQATTDTSSALPSYQGSVRTYTARQAYRRVRRVLRLQWRGIAIVVVILTNVVFFAVVFLSMDQNTANTNANIEKAQPWLLCLVLNGGDKNACLDKAAPLVANEATVLAVLIMLSINGFWNLALLGRMSMVTGWIDLIRQRFFRPNEFVSADARRLSTDPRTYEMLSNTPQPTPLKPPEAIVMNSPESLTSSRGFSPVKSGDRGDYFGREAKYISPSLSFSSPRPPSSHATHAREWDPRDTHAAPDTLPGVGIAKTVNFDP